MLREGQIVLFDVNRTPAIHALAKGGLVEKAVRHLAGGIWSMLKGA